MNRLFREADHERARGLAAESMAAELAEPDATWLAGHLDGCPACRQVAEEYASLRAELRSLPIPEPPRDLWARTAAALDGVDRERARSLRRRLLQPGPRLPAFAGAVAALAVVVAVVATSLNGGTKRPPSQTSLPPIAQASASAAVEGEPLAHFVTSDGSQVVYLARTADGTKVLAVRTVGCGEGLASACPLTKLPGTQVAMLANSADVKGIAVDNSSHNVAVWTTDGKIVVVPLSSAQAPSPTPVPIDSLTPPPTVKPTPVPSPTLTATPGPTSSPSPGSEKTPRSTPATSVGPNASPSPNGSPAGSPSAGQTMATASLPAATPSPTPPAATPTTGPSSSPAAQAIFAGLELVGHDPAFSEDGSWLAFSARPAGSVQGPDVYVWHVSDAQARPVTTSHSAVFSGWFGGQILYCEFGAATGSDGSAASASPASTSATTVTVSYLLDPEDGTLNRIDRPMLYPTIDPSERYVVYWAGSVSFDTSRGLWQPAAGDLFLDSWTNLRLIPVQPGAAGASAVPSATASAQTAGFPPAVGSPDVSPSAGASGPVSSPSSSAIALSPTSGSPPPQLLSPETATGAVGRWEIHWDATGQHVGLWAGDADPTHPGHITLRALDTTTGRIAGGPLLDEPAALPGFQMTAKSITYLTAAANGNPEVQTFSWPR